MVAGDRDEMTRQEATSDGADADSYIKQSGVGWGEVGFGGLGALGGVGGARLDATTLVWKINFSSNF